MPKHLIISISLLFITSIAHSAIRSVKVGINGLTCSMCSRTVEKSMLQLPFVDKVEMSLEATEAKILLKPEASVSMKEIARSVKDAGFSVRFVSVEFDFSDIRVGEDGSFFCQGQSYSWVGKRMLPAGKSVSLRIIDPGFVPPNEKSKWAALIASSAKSNDLHVVQE